MSSEKCGRSSRRTKRAVSSRRGRQIDFNSGIRDGGHLAGLCDGHCSELQAAKDELLHATYTPADQALCDVENVLIYNLESTSCFRSSTHEGVRFERAFSYPPAPPTSPADAGPGHYYRYEIVPASASFRHWHQADIVARVHAPLDSALPLDVTTLWWALKTR